MLNALINFSLRQRALILVLALIVVVLSYRQATTLPVDVLPDLTKPTVTLLTEAHGLSPEEVETRVTIPLEKSLMGVTGVNRLRTVSDIGLSLTFIEFDWGTDIYQARQFVQERLTAVDLPPSITPYMTPATSLMGNIMLVGLSDPTHKTSPQDLRTLADWTVARKLQAIPGIAEVLPMGGGIKQIQVQPDPHRMRAYQVSYDELRHAISNALRNSTGGYITGNGQAQEIMVRNLAMTTDLEVIAQTPIRHREGGALRIADVAQVVWGTEPQRGDAGVATNPLDQDRKEKRHGHPAVTLSITKAPGFDTIALTREIEKTMAEISTTLPSKVELVTLYRQTDYIDTSLHNLSDALLHGAIMVALVLFIFLFNLRITLITLTAIPLSLGIALLVFDLFGLGINAMTLGGFAVAIGMVVDDAIVDVENVFRRLRENANAPTPLPKLQVIARASSEIRSSILYATVLIILVFIPLLSLSGVEGRLFSPIAIATIVSMAASFLVSLTVIPVLSSFLLNPKKTKRKNGLQKPQDSFLMAWLKTLFSKTILRFALAQPFLIMALAAALLIVGFLIYPTMGKNFLPPFREPTTVVATTASPGTSLEKTTQISHTALDLLLEIPEVKIASFRAGRAENGDHVVPVSTVEFDVEYHEPHHFKNPRPHAEVLADVHAKLKSIPGTFSAMSSPLADRIGHMLSGVSAKIAIKIYGDDLDTLRELGGEVTAIARSIPGLEQARSEQQASIPQLRIEHNPHSQYSITAGELNDQLAALIGGETLGQVYEGQRSYDLVMRLPQDWRESRQKIAELYFPTQSGIQVPLSDLAHLRQANGPNNIMRENTQRRFVVSINPTSQNLVELVEELKARIKSDLKLPAGYSIDFEGEYLAQQDATQRILLTSALILLIITFLLYTYFRSINFTIQVLLDIPIALTGGVILTYYTLNNISIATLVGFIAIAGISARNSIMLVSHYLHLMRHEGEGFTKEMIVRGTQERLVPVLLTALSAGIALLPLTIDLSWLPLVGQFIEAGDPSLAPGKEILNPVALVIVGGLLTSTLFGLIVTPAIFFTFGKKSAHQAIKEKAPATS